MEYLEIGLPPTTKTSNIDESKIAREHLLMAKIFPMKPKLEASFRLFRLEPVNPDLTPDAPKPMIVYFSPTTIQETYTNELTENFLAEILRYSGRLGQITQMLGLKPEDILQSLGGLVGSFAGAAGTQALNKISQAIVATLSGTRYDLPKVWADSRAEVTKELRVRLHCNSPSNDNEYRKYIVKPLVNILKFVLPICTVAEHYRWPYFCKVEAPGLFILPEAMVTNVTVDKGVSVLFGTNNRPVEVEVTIQISSVRNVMVNDTSQTQTDVVYKLSEYERNLLNKKATGNVKTALVSGTSTLVSPPPIPSKTVSSTAQQIHERLKQALAP